MHGIKYTQLLVHSSFNLFLFHHTLTWYTWAMEPHNSSSLPCIHIHLHFGEQGASVSLDPLPDGIELPDKPRPKARGKRRELSAIEPLSDEDLAELEDSE